MKNKGWLATGLVVGLIAGSCASAFAADGIQYIKASINDTFKFEVNGQQTELPDEYKVIVYNNRTYLPVRAIGDMVGAGVDWDDTSKTVKLTTTDNSGNSNQSEALPGSTGSDGSQNAESKTYKTLPQIYETTKFRVDAEEYFTDDYGDRLYIKLKNKETGVLRLVSKATTYTIDGKTYGLSDITTGYWDTRWYTQYMEEDGTLEGYLRLPRDLEEFDKMTVHIELQYDGSDKTYPVEFDIAL
jgi:hypothetical protein